MTSFLTSKAIALFIGASGMALVGNLRNFLSSLEALGTLGIQNGIIKRVAENYSDKKKLSRLFSVHFLGILILSVILGIGIVIFSEFISNKIFDQGNYSTVLRAIGILFPFQALNVYCIAFLNGLSRYKKVVWVNSVSYLSGLVLSVVLMYFFRTMGALLAVSVIGLVLFLVSFYFVKEEITGFQIENLRSSFKELKGTLSYGLMSLFSAVISPLIYLFIRNLVINWDSLDAAGYYEAMNKISALYMMFISSMITLYYLPEFSKNTDQIRTLTKNYLTKIIPLFVLALSVLYLLRMYFIPLFLSKEFLPVSHLFFWQMLGDIFKAASLILGIQFYARKLVKPYFVFEIISFATMISLSWFLISYAKVEGAVMAYCGTYFVYFVMLWMYFNGLWRKQIK